MWRADARSAQICRCDGKTVVLQLTLNSGEPLKPGSARNLLSKHDCRLMDSDATSHLWPQVPLIAEASPPSVGA
jgi:hypothetical protein